jgi:hypothetical protein
MKHYRVGFVNLFPRDFQRGGAYADINIMRTCCREGQFCRVFWLRKSA